jgi:methyltransferase-like protein
LAHGILQTYLARFAELRRCKPCLVLEVSARPQASALARHQAAGEGSIHSLRYRGVDIDPLDRVILTQLDGTRDRAALVDFLSDLVADGTLAPRLDAAESAHPATVRDWLERTLEASLSRLAQNALLIA